MEFEYTQQALDYLSARDAKLGGAIARIGWIKREVNPDIFASLVHSIVSQQISRKAAATVWQRLQARCGEVSWQNINAVPADQVQQCGLSLRKVGYIKALGEAVASGRLDVAALTDLGDQEIVQTLSALPGIGVWTAEMLLIFSLGRPDVVSWGDLAIRRGMIVLYGLESLPRQQFEAYRQRYTPYGSVASLYLWAVSNEIK